MFYKLQYSACLIFYKSLFFLFFYFFKVVSWHIFIHSYVCSCSAQLPLNLGTYQNDGDFKDKKSLVHIYQKESLVNIKLIVTLKEIINILKRP